MIPHAVHAGDIPAEMLRRLIHCRHLLKELPAGLDCHQVCEALAPQLDATHVRGRFHERGWPHSWLFYPNHNCILDPYPWAASGPILVTLNGMSPWQNLYIEEPDAHERWERNGQP